uniref:Uncharacterized protein n=1 Tax=Strigamia maritima TaxID=126957 RepID=T1JKI6_STRMM
MIINKRSENGIEPYHLDLATMNCIIFCLIMEAHFSGHREEKKRSFASESNGNRGPSCLVLQESVKIDPR